MAHIVVVGSANVDLVARASHIPRPGETVLGYGFVMAMGGKGGNQAVGAARLGADVTFITCIGNDSFGDQCLSAYHTEGIHTDFIIRDSVEPTGIALISVADGGENSILVASGANMRLLPEHITDAAEIFKTAHVLQLQLEVPLETNIAAARIAHENGMKVILNPAPAQPLPPELLSLVDVITPNRIESAMLMGISEEEVESYTDEQIAKGVLALGPSEAVITLGSQGALVAGSWGYIRVPAFKVTPVDTTAAGDAFNAGLAVALARGTTSLEQAARYAAACGALATTKMGAQPSLPTALAVDELIAAR